MARSRVAVLLLCVVAHAGAYAQEGTVEDRKAVMDAQIEILNKQAELQRALRQVAGTLAMGLPVVASITQMAGQRVARLQLRNGVVGHFREGDMVQPGMVVTSIAAKQVLVAIENGKRGLPVPLEFAATATSQLGAGPGALLNTPVPDALLPSPPKVSLPAIGLMPMGPAGPAAKPGQSGK